MNKITLIFADEQSAKRALIDLLEMQQGNAMWTAELRESSIDIEGMCILKPLPANLVAIIF